MTANWSKDTALYLRSLGAPGKQGPADLINWSFINGQWFMALVAQGQEKFGARARGLGDQRQIFLGLEPRALGHEPWAMSREPLTIHNRLINELL